MGEGAVGRTFQTGTKEQKHGIKNCTRFRSVCEGQSKWEALGLGLCPKVKAEP